MACECFVEKDFAPSTRAIITEANEIIDEYLADGLKLTLRQLYYRMIGLDKIPDSWIDHAYNAKNGLPPDTKNTLKNYKRLGSILNDARLGGLVDWEAIEDRGRTPDRPVEFDDPNDLMKTALRIYRRPRWGGQDEYVEVWVEKQALAGVLKTVTKRWHVTLMVNKGYSSASAMKEAAERIYAAEADCKTIIYVGDHDPSGEDMVRDVRERLHLLGSGDVDVEKVAITWEQIQRYKPPPNPAKLNDARAAKYIKKFGDRAWEVDALHPKVLNKAVEDAIRARLDEAVMQEIIAREEEEKAALAKLAAKLAKGK